MAPYACWVHDVFRHILVESCDEFLQTSDRGGDKARSQFVTNIASQITVIFVRCSVSTCGSGTTLLALQGGTIDKG